MTIINDEIKTLFSQVLQSESESCNLLFKRYSTLSELMNASEYELEKKIDTKHAKKVYSIITLIKKIHFYEAFEQCIRSPKDVIYLLRSEYKFATKEHFIGVFLNSKNRVIHKEIISIGSLNASIVHPREVFNAAIRHCSASLICVHNHPSGDPTPSQEDIQITKRLVEAGNIIGIDVLDHIIIGENRYYSLKEHGHM